jgi:hypothetical protein
VLFGVNPGLGLSRFWENTKNDEIINRSAIKSIFAFLLRILGLIDPDIFPLQILG